ncbi:hypothetical protein SNEBB_001164 [Seison nebaliae]|nr:hypothetical protein SNEBB_001164 [Seison nebaliae]
MMKQKSKVFRRRCKKRTRRIKKTATGVKNLITVRESEQTLGSIKDTNLTKTRKRKFQEVIELAEDDASKNSGSDEGANAKVSRILETITIDLSSTVKTAGKIKEKPKKNDKLEVKKKEQIHNCGSKEINKILDDEREFMKEFNMVRTSGEVKLDRLKLSFGFKNALATAKKKMDNGQVMGNNIEHSDNRTPNDDTDVQKNERTFNHEKINNQLGVESNRVLKDNSRNKCKLDGQNNEDELLTPLEIDDITGTVKTPQLLSHAMHLPKKDYKKLFPKSSTCILKGEPFVHSQQDRTLQNEIMEYLNIKPLTFHDESRSSGGNSPKRKLDMPQANDNCSHFYPSISPAIEQYSNYHNNSVYQDLSIFKINKIPKLKDQHKNVELEKRWKERKPQELPNTIILEKSKKMAMGGDCTERTKITEEKLKIVRHPTSKITFSLRRSKRFDQKCNENYRNRSRNISSYSWA